MIKKYKTIRQKLFDGEEDHCLKEVFKIGDQEIRSSDFYNNTLRELRKEIDNESFDIIVEESTFRLQNNLMEKYTSVEGLEINYLKINNFIYIFSYGEYQSGRYLLFLESIWIVR